VTDSSRPLDIIIPIYKNAALVRACVGSLLSNMGEIADLRPRLVLINDSPGDEEVEVLLLSYASVSTAPVVLHNERNLGFVRTVNRGLAQAQCDGHDVLLVNSDTQTYPGTLRNLLKAAHADPQIGFASPRSNNASICSLPHFFGPLQSAPEESLRKWLEISRTMPAYHFAPTAVGFYMYIANSVLANHGGLREDFGVGYEEENDLVMRAGKLGTRAVIVNHAFAYHIGSASFDLVDIELSAHKHRNLVTLCDTHKEFLPLVKRYEKSSHFQAERLMTGILNDAEGRTKVVFDLTGMGQHYNGTNEQVVAVLRSMAKRHSHRIRLAGIGTAESFRCHGLDQVKDLHREEPGAPGLHGIAVRMAQPFELRHISTLESLAPLNVFAMLDTIAEDCGPLTLADPLLELWDHAAEHASGLIYTSRFAEQTFCNRHPAAYAVPSWRCLLPTRLASYARPGGVSKGSHVLVLGNHFAHKGSELAARTIAAAFPDISVVALGEESRQASNLTVYRAGLIKPEFMDGLFDHASVVVLPSHVEGFGLGFMHALAAGRPIVARRIPATEEILATLDEVEGVFLFESNADLVTTFKHAQQVSASRAKDSRGNSWDDWAAGLTNFLLSLITRDDIFERLVGRIRAGEHLRRAARGDTLAREASGNAAGPVEAPGMLSNAKALDLHSLLALEGRLFVEHAYATLLHRPADESGLQAHLDQLELGVHKVDILAAISRSPEGRLRDINLPGLDVMVAQLRRSRLPLYKRLFS
jgi:GT2 family glycosyltransferase